MTKIFLAASCSALTCFAFARMEPVAAQPIQPTEEIIVIAPYLVEKKEIKANPHQRLMEISAERHVSCADLDLSNPEDAAKFKQRINDAAVQACSQLDREYPPQGYVPVSTGQSCAKSATNEAMMMANEIIEKSRG